jgi:hypothetical protein
MCFLIICIIRSGVNTFGVTVNPSTNEPDSTYPEMVEKGLMTTLSPIIDPDRTTLGPAIKTLLPIEVRSLFISLLFGVLSPPKFARWLECDHTKTEAANVQFSPIFNPPEASIIAFSPM